MDYAAAPLGAARTRKAAKVVFVDCSRIVPGDLFTGLDLGFIALAGLVLVLAGVGLHRVTRKPSEPPAA